MQELNLEYISQQLNKRLDYPYIWGRQQNNQWDKLTNYIYGIKAFDELMARIQNECTDVQNYAMNRWFNYWSAKAVEHMFAQHQSVIPHYNQYDKLTDFALSGVDFDHKTSVLPKCFEQNAEYILRNKDELIRWLYVHQSQQGRKHLGNRLFIILYDQICGEHWKMKADLKHINVAVSNYIHTFNIDNLLKFETGQNTALSDAIFICNSAPD